MMNHKKNLSSIALLVFILALFIVTPFYGIILDGDELHSIIFSTGNREFFNSGYVELMDHELTASEWKKQISEVNGFNLIKVWNDTLMYDVHPPLYHCILHILFFLFGSSILSAYLLNAFLLLASLHLISSKRNQAFASNWTIIAFFPFILNGCLDIRPYCLLFYFGLQCYFMLKENDVPFFKFSIFLILGLLTNYLFFIFVVALFLGRIISQRIDRKPGNNNKFILLCILLTFLFSYIALGHNNQFLTIANRIDFDQHFILDKLSNVSFAFVGLSFPLWIFKLTNYFFLYLSLFVVGVMVSINIIYFFYLKRSRFVYDISIIIIYFSLYLTLYFLEIIPHHSVGGKYFLLLTIPFILPIMKMLRAWNNVKFLVPAFLILILFGEALFRGNERIEISKMMDKKFSLYSNSNDAFTVLRLVHAMDDEKKIFIGRPEKTPHNNFDQLFIVTYPKPKTRYDASLMLHESYKGQQMVLRKFHEIGVFYYK